MPRNPRNAPAKRNEMRNNNARAAFLWLHRAKEEREGAKGTEKKIVL